MLRQSGSLAQRLFCSGVLQNTSNQATGGSKLVWNAAFYSSKSGSAAGSSTEVAVVSGVQSGVSQFTSAACAALAKKKEHLTGMGSVTLGKMTRPFSTAARGFAANGAAAQEAAAAGAAGAAPKAASLLSRLAKASMALVAGLMIAASPAAADTPEAWQYGFQDSATSQMQAAVDLHHDVSFFVLTIVVLVAYMLLQISTKFHYSKVAIPEKLTHHTALEVAWTIIPTIIVLLIAIPSLTLIYSLDQHTDRPGLTVKVVGRQWYWSYEMHDHLQQKLLDPDRLVSIAEKSLIK